MSDFSTTTDVKDYIDSQLKNMERGLVATPTSRGNLDSFAKANQGSMDFLLTQMAVNYGYKIAMQNVLETINQEENGQS